MVTRHRIQATSYTGDIVYIDVHGVVPKATSYPVDGYDVTLMYDTVSIQYDIVYIIACFLIF